MRKVALFSSDFLAYSKTFIYEEIKQHTRYQIDVFTRRRKNVARFPYDRVFVAGPLYGYTRLSPLFERTFRAEHYDLAHAHFGTGGVYAMRYAENFRLPLVVTFHGFDVPLLTSSKRFVPERWGYALLGKRVLRKMMLGLCASTELRDMLLKQGVPESRLRIHRLGVDLTSFSPLDGSKLDPAMSRVIMVGRLVEKKGFEYGIRAFAQQAAGHPSARLTIIGDGELEKPLRALVKALGIDRMVTFTGVLSHAEVLQRLREAEVLLAPSVVAAGGDRESGVMVIKEASACGVAPIGTFHGGIPEIIDDGETGFLAPERDVSALSERLGRLLDDAPLRERMGRAARAKMEREYDSRKRNEELESVYDEVIERFAKDCS